MAVKLSTGLVNLMMGFTGGGSFKSIFENSGGTPAGFVIDIYTGTQPASADDASTSSTLLVTVQAGGTTGATFESAATVGNPNAGEIQKNGAETWSGTAVATGTAGWFRLRRKEDTGTGSSATEPRYDGSIATSGAQMNLGSLSIQTGAPFLLDAGAFTMPKA